MISREVRKFTLRRTKMRSLIAIFTTLIFLVSVAAPAAAYDHRRYGGHGHWQQKQQWQYHHREQRRRDNTGALFFGLATAAILLGAISQANRANQPNQHSGSSINWIPLDQYNRQYGHCPQVGQSQDGSLWCAVR